MIILQWVRFGIAALLMIAGLLLLFAALVGIFRFNNVLCRIHTAAKCDTFGLLLTFSSLMVMSEWGLGIIKLFLIIAFFWLTVPVSNHLIAYMELITNPKIKDQCKMIGDPLHPATMTKNLTKGGQPPGQGAK